MNKQAFLTAVNDEIARIVFLAGKLTPSEMDFKLSESGRTTGRLLQYLSVAASGYVAYLVTGSFKEHVAHADDVTLETFADAMGRQREDIEKFVTQVSDEDWNGKEVELPWQVKRTFCDAVVESSLAFLVAYRMQLFLHLKVNGHDDFTTWECWGGIDNPERVGGKS